MQNKRKENMIPNERARRKERDRKESLIESLL
jgi:hypothetical protein